MRGSGTVVVILSALLASARALAPAVGDLSQETASGRRAGPARGMRVSLHGLIQSLPARQEAIGDAPVGSGSPLLRTVFGALGQ